MKELTSLQKSALKSFSEKLERKVYEVESLLCPICHTDNRDELIISKDRYGFSINTVICLKCALIRTNPYYTDNTLGSFYNNEYRIIYGGEKTPNGWFLIDQYRRGFTIVKKLEKMGINLKNKDIFEIGCGAGGLLVAFRDSGANVSGCDIGEEYLKHGSKLFHLDLKFGSFVDFAKNDSNKFDLIILSHVIEHIKDPIFLLNKIKIMLKPRGLVVIEAPGLMEVPFTYHSFINLIQNAHVFNFCLNTLRSVTSRAGYTLINGDESIFAVLKIGKDNYDIKKNFSKNYNQQQKIIINKFNKPRAYVLILIRKILITIYTIKSAYRLRKYLY